MAIFSRRRVQRMLDELTLKLGSARPQPLGRLRNKRPEQVLGAEMELALLWAINQVADLSIEKEFNGARPDAYSEDFLGNAPAIIEVTTASDDDHMRRAAYKISDRASSLRSGAGAHLSFDFQEESKWEKGEYFRRRSISGDFELDAALSLQLAHWLRNDRKHPLRLRNNDVDVYIVWKGKASKRPGVYSRMPHIAYSLTDNPVFKALNKPAKSRQLRSAPSDALKCIFLADAGCSILTRLYHRDPLGQEKSGADIINHYLRKNKADAVCVFVPTPESREPMSFGGKLRWQVSVFYNPEKIDRAGLIKFDALTKVLPRPRFNGQNARSLQRQGAFSSRERGWCLGTKINFEKDRNMTIKISARGLQEYLAGRLTREQFERQHGVTDNNIFDFALRKGKTIGAVSLESAGPDRDDDYIVFEMAPDPAASDLK